jgi:hypothetical protein
MAILDIGRVMFGEELDLPRGSPESVVFLEGGQQHLADEPWHLASRCLHRQDDADRLDHGGVVRQAA